MPVKAGERYKTPDQKECEVIELMGEFAVIARGVADDDPRPLWIVKAESLEPIE